MLRWKQLHLRLETFHTEPKATSAYNARAVKPVGEPPGFAAGHAEVDGIEQAERSVLFNAYELRHAQARAKGVIRESHQMAGRASGRQKAGSSNQRLRRLMDVSDITPYLT